MAKLRLPLDEPVLCYNYIKYMFTLPKLQFSYDALEPYIDALTMEIHHTKHHQTYIDKLNAIVEANSNLKDKTLEELCLLPETKNMAGGHYNHSFFWQIIGPNSSDGSVPDEIKPFKDEFNQKALTFFGSGWTWIVKDGNKLEVITTSNQDSPLLVGKNPVLALDLWEHAYYLKYQNKRVDYIDAWWNIVNWNKVKSLLK